MRTTLYPSSPAPTSAKDRILLARAEAIIAAAHQHENPTASAPKTYRDFVAHINGIKADPVAVADYYTRFAGNFNLPGAAATPGYAPPRTVAELNGILEAARQLGPAEETLAFHALQDELKRATDAESFQATRQPQKPFFLKK
jgi:hypothetical protein